VEVEEHVDGDASQNLEDNSSLLVVNTKVVVRCKGADRNGTIRFVGETHFHPGVKWVGVELNFPIGNNDGTMKGVFYFPCKAKYGIFVKPDAILREQKNVLTRAKRSNTLPGNMDKQKYVTDQLALINSKLKDATFPDREQKSIIPTAKSPPSAPLPRGASQKSLAKQPSRTGVKFATAAGKAATLPRPQSVVNISQHK